MPFTLCHPAAVLPLHKLLANKLVVSALIIGSLSPDFTYFFHQPFLTADTHSISALFWFCLPAGIIAYYLFHRVLKFPLYALLPRSFQERIKLEQLLSYRPLNLNLVASILLGALTHIIWDSFTHAGSPMVESFEILKTLLFEVGNYKVWTYKLLQHGSSCLGLIVIIGFVLNWRRTTPVNQDALALKIKTKTKVLITLALILTPVVMSILLTLDHFPASFSFAALQPIVGLIIKSSLSYFFIAMIGYSLLFRCFSK